MSAPSLYRSPPRRPQAWLADRPGEVVGRGPNTGSGFGSQGPDQGYMLKLAESVADQVILGDGERLDDAMAGCCAVALRRASIFSRGPVIHDLRLALELFGFLTEPDAALLASRRDAFAGAAGHHGYHTRMHLAGLVPEATLRQAPGTLSVSPHELLARNS